MSWRPLVSIVIPVYNGVDYLAEAIGSALVQTYPNIEIVVVNDGSTDGGATEAIAKSFGTRVRYYYKENGHVASALNYGIARMTGDYFSWLSHDDLYHPDKVEAQMRAVQRLSPRTVVYSDFEAMDVATGAVSPVRLPDTPPEYFRWFLTVNNSLHGCTLLIPRACFDECGLFNETLKTTQDYDMWFRIAERYQFAHLPQILVTARLHPGQGSRQLQAVAMQECDQLLERFIADLSPEEICNATGKPLSHAYVDIATNMHARGFRRARNLASGLARRELRGDPPLRTAWWHLVLFRQLLPAPKPALCGLASKVLRQIRGLTTRTGSRLIPTWGRRVERCRIALKGSTGANKRPDVRELD